MDKARPATTRDAAFRTPDWLERSFVLPTQHRPAHDDLPVPVDVTARESRHTRMAAAQFVRPATDTVDFARLLRRRKSAQLARRTALVGVALMALAAVLTVVVTGPLTWTLLGIAVAMTLWSVGVAVRLSRAPVPYLRG